MLQLYDGPHSDGQRVAPHLQRLDESLGGIHFLLNIEQRLLRLTAHMVTVLLELRHRIDKRLRHLQLRQFTIVECERHRAVVVGIDDEVWRDLLQAPADGLSQRGTRPWIQLPQFVEHLFSLGVVKRQARPYLIPMLTGELLEIVGDHLLHLYLHPRRILSVNLQEQALLKRRGTDACGVKALQQFLHLTQFRLRGVDVMIDGQFVADGVERLTEQSVIIERTDQILHNIVLTGCHIQ